MFKDQILQLHMLGVWFGHVYCVTIPERVKCTGNNVTMTTATPYMVRPVTSYGCYLGGLTALPPGPPRVNTTSQRNNFSVHIQSPYDASVNALKGFLVKIFVSAEPYNPDSETCYVINFTKTYTSADELKEIMNAAFFLHCIYTGAQPSDITVLTSSYPESIATARVRQKIRVPGKFTPVTDILQPSSSTTQQQSTAAQAKTEKTTGATRYVVAFILSVVVSVTVTLSVIIVVKWRRKRTRRFHIHSDDE